MKKWLYLLFSLCLIVHLTACSNDSALEGTDSSQDGAPSFIGMTYDDVMNTPIYTETYTIEKSEQYSDTAEAGVITDQSPRPGQSMRSNVIRIVVSKGPRYATTTTTQALRKRIPRVVDTSLEEAMEKLTGTGFIVDPNNIVYVNNDVYERGMVVSQDPASGTYGMTGTEVQLTVSSGYVDAQITVDFPVLERTIDLQVYVDGKKQSESDLGVPLSNLLMMDLQSFSFTTSVQKSSYKVEVYTAQSGTQQFDRYAVYTVNGTSGEVTRTALYSIE